MREVRMTFGEHLEELRNRIIWSLLWLGITTTVCFVYGETLLIIAQQPHLKAVRSATNIRHAVSLDESGTELEQIMQDSITWAPFFPDLLKAAADNLNRGERLEETRSLAGQVAGVFPALTDPEKQQLESLLLAFARSILDAASSIKVPESLMTSTVKYLEGFVNVTKKIEEVAERYKSSPLQQSLGLGRSYEGILGTSQKFVNHLESARTEIAKSLAFYKDRDKLETRFIELEADGNREETMARVDAVLTSLTESADALLSKKEQPLKLKKYQEGFSSYFLIALVFGIFLALPLILWEVWKFVGAGLYVHEQKFVLIFAPFSFVLFAAGVVFGYFWMIPFVLEFLATWGASYAEPDFTLGDFVTLFFTMTVLLGLVFQTPLVMIFLHQIDMVSAAGFARARKYTLLGAVIFSTMVTPPDPLSWSMMAGPIMLLYELGIRICRHLEKRKKRRGDSDTVTAER